MTNNEAKDYLTALWGSDDISIDETIALEMAIKALEQQPCEDAISRKDMLAVLRQSHSLTQAWDGFEKLPSVTPEEKTGKWIKTQSGDDMFPEIIVCSKCNNENSHLDFNEHAEPIGKVFIKSRYCPNCGARMVSE